MTRIEFPLKERQTGAAVANLQDGLKRLLDRGVLTIKEATRRVELTAGLAAEHLVSRYGPATAALVELWQEQHDLKATGKVDEATAASLNKALELSDPQPAPTPPPSPAPPTPTPTPPTPAPRPEATHRIAFPLEPGQTGAAIANLQGALRTLIERGLLVADDERMRGELSSMLLLEQASQSYGAGTRQLVALFQEPLRLAASGETDKATAAALNSLLEVMGLLDRDGGSGTPEPDETPDAGYGDDRQAETFRVEGRVASRTRAAAAGLRVVVVDKAVGGDTPLVETATDASGCFEARFAGTGFRERGKDKPDLQARVYSGESYLGASAVRYNASPRETLNVLIDDTASAALHSEYEALTAALARHHQGPLAELQETEERRDVTYLANKSGWDARAVALAALADQFSARTGGSAVPGPRIEAPFFYALFRSGVAANEASLYRIDPATVETIWTQAIRQGAVPAALADKLPDAVGQFRQLAAERLLNGPALTGASSFRELIAGTLAEPRQQQGFAALCTSYGGDPATLWAKTRKAFGEAATNRLRLDGQLAYLTLNNAPLIGKLHARAGRGGLAGSAELVAAGFHRAEQWQLAIGGDPIPPEIPGRDDSEKRERYAELLAAQVRLSFPTATVAQMVKSGETPTEFERRGDRVHAFLTEHDGRFEIGVEPVARYAKQNDIRLDPDVAHEISRIQRVYQISPDDKAMNGLLRAGIDSATATVRYERETFVRTFRDAVGGEDNARLIHAKAEQVHAAVLNVAIAYLTAKGAPGIGVHSPAAIVDPNPQPLGHADDVLAYATLESLFGEMDYCACEHCRSVLSPAAYLVDLLKFIDRMPADIPVNFENPLTVLLLRRPDIQYLPLTCANTNTPMPYIDLVLETLEHYVSHGLSLSSFAGHDTDGSVPPEELLASPQFVSDLAYTALAAENFPPPLPFDQPLSYLRRCFARFEAPLAEVMEDLHSDDSLTLGIAADYFNIRMEEIGLSRPEHRLLTKCWPNTGAVDVMLTVKQLYGFDPATPDADVRTVLDNAKSFCRRVGISYAQLVEILKTRFANPNAELIPQLERLGVPFATLKALKDGTISNLDFDNLLAPGLDPAAYANDIKAWVKNSANYGRIMSLLTLSNPADPENICDFDAVELRYSNPDAAANKLRSFEFVRLIRFIRIWRKLGWTIEQTDRALVALFPAAQTPNDPNDAVNVQRLDLGFLALLPSLAILKRAMAALGLTPKRDLSALLACVALIGTHGQSSLYAQMFLGLSQSDGAFADDGYGGYFTHSANLLDHEATLRAAFALTSDEFNEIVAALLYDGTTPLNLANISAVFRRGWLARKLRLSVREFLLLTKATGYDPFGTPAPIHPGLLDLIGFVNRLRALGVKPAEALYLVWNQDLSGKSVPAEAEICGFARTLRVALAEIESAFTVVADPDGSITRARMALVYGDEATDLFFGLLEYKVPTAVPYNHGQAVLEAAILAAAPGRIAYDDLAKRLSFTGVLSMGTWTALKAVAGVSAGFKSAVDALYAANQQQIAPFFARYPELRPLHDAYVASPDPEAVKRTVLLGAFLPKLKDRRKRQQALQSFSAVAKADLGLSSALLEEAAVLHAADDPVGPALDDLTALEQPGLTANYYSAPTVTGSPNLTHEAWAGLEYAPLTPNHLMPNMVSFGAPISGTWDGYVEAPENGLYKLEIETEAAATVTLMLDDAPVALSKVGGTWSNVAPIELRAGALYRFALKVENVTDNLAVRWQTQAQGWQVIPLDRLYSAMLVDRLRRTYVRFLKAAALASALKLSAAETSHLAVDYKVAGKGWLNALTVTGSPPATTAADLFKAFAGLLDFARLKRDLSPDDERLLAVLADPVAATAAPQSLLFALARWDKASVDALLARFGLAAADLKRVEILGRVHDAYRWASLLGVSAAQLIAAATNAPTPTVVRDLQSALRARHDESGWLDVLKPINDELRTAQRDALVASILHKMRSNPASAHIDTPNKLFEYFLMDVQMECCMLTSRVRHALSSVQLFIDRCLMNLEKKVSPSTINAKQWEWMKIYRIWEANRKIFLFPENWLEPEFRDDQSPFFKEAMSELLQGDITEDRAAEALVDYLTKLEDVAKLEICGMHFVEGSPGTADDITHVVARTAGANRKYFYRRRDYGAWMAWEKIPLDIEDNPVLPVLWKDRLFLFWVKLLKETEQAPPATPPGSTLAGVHPADAIPHTAPTIAMRAILTWSEFIGGKWQPPRTSDPAAPLLLMRGLSVDEANSFRSRIKLWAMFWTNDSLRLIISDESGVGASFFLHNAFSTPEPREGKKAPHFSPKRLLDTSAEPLTVSYAGPYSHGLLTNSLVDGTVEPHHPQAGAPWDAPFFYEDGRHVFYVTTSQKLVPLPQWNNFGMGIGTYDFTTDLPGLIQSNDIGFAELGIELNRQPGFGFLDPAAIAHQIGVDANIKTAIGTPGTVPFGDYNIGPSGSQVQTGETN